MGLSEELPIKPTIHTIMYNCTLNSSSRTQIQCYDGVWEGGGGGVGGAAISLHSLVSLPQPNHITEKQTNVSSFLQIYTC